MATKTKTLRLSFPHYDNAADGPLARQNAPRVYAVEQATDTTEFAPGQQLSRAKVDELCAARDWKVTIVPVKL